MRGRTAQVKILNTLTVGEARSTPYKLPPIYTLSIICIYYSHHPGRVRSALFSPSGHRLYTCCSSGTLALFDSSQQPSPLLRLLGNAVAREGGGGEREERGRLGQQSMALSEDGKRLACIGPLSCNISVLDALSLSEVREPLRIATIYASVPSQFPLSAYFSLKGVSRPSIKHHQQTPLNHHLSFYLLKRLVFSTCKLSLPLSMCTGS